MLILLAFVLASARVALIVGMAVLPGAFGLGRLLVKGRESPAEW